MTSFSTSGYLNIKATMTTTFEDEDNGNSDSQKCDDSGRKRKADDVADNKKEELAMKRKRNREAAKKCRERKLQVSEDLMKRNQELEQENCLLVKQRDELMKKCQEYEEEMNHHKQQGCRVLSFSPPYDLSQILDPDIPPSPSYFTSASTSISPCPSPALSTSPASLVTSTLHANEEVTDEHDCHNGTILELENSKRNNSYMMPTKTTEMPATVTSQPTNNASQESAEYHYLLVRDKDGSPKELCLSREDYIKVTARMKALMAVSTKQPAVQSNYSTAPTRQLQQMPLTLQAKADNPLKMDAGTSQSLNFMSQVKTVAGSSRQTERLVTVDDNMSYITDMSDCESQLDFTVVNPNQIFIEDNQVDAECDETFTSQLMADFSTVQTETDGIRIQTNLDDESLHYGQTGIITEVTKENNMFDLEIGQIRQTNLAMPELDGYITEQGLSPDSFTYPEPGQCLPYISTSVNLVTDHTNKVISNSCQAVPVVLQEDESPLPVINFSNPKHVSRVIEYHQPLSKPISMMKTIKLRPKATQQMTSESSVLAGNTLQMVNDQFDATPVQFPQNGLRVMTVDKDNSAPLKDLRIINTSGSLDLKQLLHNQQSVFQNISAQKGVIQKTVPHQQVSQRVPIIPISQSFQF